MNCSFRRNNSTVGGAIYTLGQQLLVKSSLFECNTAKLDGGAVYAINNSIVDISNSSFKENEGRQNGGAITATEGKIVIRSSLFEYNTAGDENKDTCGGAIQFYSARGYAHLNRISTLNILNCSFKGNRAGSFGGAIRLTGGKFTMEASSFDNNSAGLQGGAVIISSSSGTISACSFTNNIARIFGGAVCQEGPRFILKTSTFQNNAVIGTQGQGGALYTQGEFHDHFNYSNFRHVNISDCIFDANHATYRGGAIMASTNILHIQNSSFLSSSYPHSLSYSGGDLIYSKSIVILKNISFLDMDKHNFQNSPIIHETLNVLHTPGDGGGRKAMTQVMLSFRSGIHIKCFSGKRIAIYNGSYSHVNPYLQYFFLHISCSFCSQSSYSLESAHLDIFSQNQSIKITNGKCFHCPLGGVCERGKVRATNNFWGYAFENQVHFVACPFGYCCFKKECVNYSSCHTSRRGILCGHCKKGFTENLLTCDCLQPEKCHHPWYWLVVMVIGIVYVFVFMFINEITQAVKLLLIPGSVLDYFKCSRKTSIQISEVCKRIFEIVKSKFSNAFNQRYDMQYLTDDVLVQTADNEEPFDSIQGNVQLVLDEEMQSIDGPQRDDDEENVLPGLLKVLIFFYQTNVLFKVDTGSKSGGFIHTLQEVVFTLFNLRTDGTFTQDLFWCPIHNLRPVSKTLLKSLFIVYLFFLLLLVSILHKTGKLLKIVKGTSLNNSRLLCCILRLALISYSGITLTCFSLVSCVQVGYFGKVLFIDGSTSCYTWWQMVTIIVVCCWIVPFPVTIYASSNLLHHNMLSAKQLLLCFTFPLPAVCYWMYTCYKKPQRELRQEKLLSQDVQDVLQIMEGPFKKLKAHGEERSDRLPWEAFLIGRRLVLIFLRTFVINTFLRLSLMLLCTALFLMHHIYTKPFSSSFLNKVETASLLMLHIICVLNLIPAYNYAYPKFSNGYSEDVVETLKTVETALNSVFPFVVGSVVTIFVCIRMFQFIFWLCQCFVRLIRFCTKHKLS